MTKAKPVTKKNPLPHVDPTLRQVLMIMSGKTNSIAGIAARSGVSRTCIYRWQKGITRRPQGITMDFVLRAMGYHRPITPINDKK
jgi:hypothetical protein